MHQQSAWTATPSSLIRAPTSAIPTIFTQDALPYTTLPFYSGLGQAPNMLACIPSGLVHKGGYMDQKYRHRESRQGQLPIQPRMRQAFSYRHRKSDVKLKRLLTVHLILVVLLFYAICVCRPISTGMIHKVTN